MKLIFNSYPVELTISWYLSAAMAMTTNPDMYTAVWGIVLKARQKNSDFFPNGQYFVNPSMAVKGMVIHNNKSELANKPIRMFRADVLSFFDLNKEATTRLFPMAATKTTMEYRQMLTGGPDHVLISLLSLQYWIFREIKCVTL